MTHIEGKHRSLDALAVVTEDFFNLHWPSEEWGNPPNWTTPWEMMGSLPGHDRQGVYALFNNMGELIYVGVGASLGKGRYKGHGIGNRVGAYIRVAQTGGSEISTNRTYDPKGRWIERALNSISTLTFDNDRAYLAYGLEAFLIAELEPQFNKSNPARRG